MNVATIYKYSGALCVYAAAENDVSIQNSSFQMANKLPASILHTQIYTHTHDHFKWQPAPPWWYAVITITKPIHPII